MVELGAVNCENPTQTFYGKLKPISDFFIPEALAVTGHSRGDTLKFDDPAAKSAIQRKKTDVYLR
jgi:hypothetical protein